jgi:hypothetical protein
LARPEALKLDFDRRLMLQFRGSVVTSDAGLLAYRELDDALGLSTMAGETLADARTGKNGRHALVGLLRQSVFGRLAGYEDVNDAERLRHDPAMRWSECWEEGMLDEILEIADDSSRDYVQRTGADGKVTWVVDREHIARCLLRIKARKWALARMTPRKYGDR